MKTRCCKSLMMICLLGMTPMAASAQNDIHFSQFYEASILRNPALTGVFAADYKAAVIYRDQWSSISNPFVTAVFCGESRVHISREADDYVSFGVLAYYDKAGSIDRKILTVYPAVNYNKSMEDQHNSFISIGFTGGYMQYSYDPSKTTFNNQYQNGAYNPANPSGENIPASKLSLWDLGAGLNFNSSAGEYNSVTYVIGVSGYHFTQPKNSYFKDISIVMDMRWNVNAAISGRINEDYAFQLQANYATQGSFSEIIGGGLVGWNRLSEGAEPMFSFYVGAFYRHLDAVIPTIKLKYRDLAFGMSYDVNISPLKVASSLRGGYELSIYKTGMFHYEASSTDKVLCPNF